MRTGFPKRTGLYTSPHLISPEERIRVNFEPLSPDKFARYFFDVWDRLSGNDANIGTRPRYLQLLLLVSFHAFICEGVEAAIFETHHGGEYDSTNVIENPVTTVITPLGIDHVQQLGPTIENIAWHKAGIFKRGALALSAPQDQDVTVEVLLRRAAAKGVRLHFVAVDEKVLPVNSPRLKPAVQMVNCSVGLAAASELIRDRSLPNGSRAGSMTEVDIRTAVDGFSWLGRFQCIVEGHHNWYLDSAHNEMSVSKAAEWFMEEVSEKPSEGPTRMDKRALVFGQISSHRDAISVLNRLAVCFKAIRFDVVIFATWNSGNDKANVTDAKGTLACCWCSIAHYGQLIRLHRHRGHED
jgi:folylpolyglutamate synthase